MRECIATLAGRRLPGSGRGVCVENWLGVWLGVREGLAETAGGESAAAAGATERAESFLAGPGMLSESAGGVVSELEESS